MVLPRLEVPPISRSTHLPKPRQVRVAPSATVLAEGALLRKLFVGGGAGEAGAQMEHALCKAFRR